MKELLSRLCLVICFLPTFSYADNAETCMEDVKEFDDNTFSKIDITFDAGVVNIDSSDGKKTPACLVKRHFSPDCKLKMEVVSNVLCIEAKGKTKESKCHIDLHVYIPSRTHVNITADAGIVSINDLKGNVAGKINSGNVTLRAPLSSLDLALGNGDVFVKEILGNSRISTGTGEIDISYGSEIKGAEKRDVALEVGTGSINVSLPAKSNVLYTFNGPPLVTSFTSAFPIRASSLILDYDVSLDLALGKAFLNKKVLSKKEIVKPILKKATRSLK
jgi:DUF4097 and DUF4098 domain-containing protein YvlB